MSRISSIVGFIITSGAGEISFYYTLLLVSSILLHPLYGRTIPEAPSHIIVQAQGAHVLDGISYAGIKPCWYITYKDQGKGNAT
jgi:hypothetical protein